MKTKEEQIEIINKAIDAIIDAVQETDVVDPAYFLNYENSVVARLNSARYSLENDTE